MCSAGRLVLLGWMAAQVGWAAAPPTPELPIEEHLCRAAGVGVEPSRLIGYLRRRTPEPGEDRLVARLVEQLGDDSFDLRRQAGERLEAMGLRVAAALEKCRLHDDLEIRRGAGRILERLARAHAIEQSLPVPLDRAVVRTLARSRHPNSAAAILRYLPHADWPETEEEIYHALDRLMPVAELLRAMADPEPARRAVAACLLGKSSDRRLRAVARRCLDDRDPLVRLRAAQGLLAAAEPDRAALPALIGLLGASPLTVAWQAEELLVFASARSMAAIGGGSTKERDRCASQWRHWWREHGARLDLSRLHHSGRRPGLVMVYQDSDRSAALWICGCDGTPRHRVEYPMRASALCADASGGAWVVCRDDAFYSVQRRGPDGKVRWERMLSATDGTRHEEIRPLSGGRCLVSSENWVIELSDAGSLLRRSNRARAWARTVHVEEPGTLALTPDEGMGTRPWFGLWLFAERGVERPSRTLFATQLAPEGLYRWWFLRPSGELFTLAPGEDGYPEVIEFDPFGRRLGRDGAEGRAVAGHRDGRRLIVEGRRVIEVAPDGRVLWQTAVSGPRLADVVCPLVRFGFRPAGSADATRRE
jgi:HEAT repeat protein